MKASGRHLPSTAMAKAIDYALSNWEALGVYLENGNVEIDDNLVYVARGINQIMPPQDLCRVGA